MQMPHLVEFMDDADHNYRDHFLHSDIVVLDPEERNRIMQKYPTIRIALDNKKHWHHEPYGKRLWASISHGISVAVENHVTRDLENEGVHNVMDLVGTVYDEESTQWSPYDDYPAFFLNRVILEYLGGKTYTVEICLFENEWYDDSMELDKVLSDIASQVDHQLNPDDLQPRYLLYKFRDYFRNAGYGYDRLPKLDPTDVVSGFEGIVGDVPRLEKYRLYLGILNLDDRYESMRSPYVLLYEDEPVFAIHFAKVVGTNESKYEGVREDGLLEIFTAIYKHDLQQREKLQQNGEDQIWLVDQAETHIATYKVKAKTRAEAIAKVLNSDPDAEHINTEYSDINHDRGMPLDEFNDEEIEFIENQVGYRVGSDRADFLESITSVRNITEEGYKDVEDTKTKTDE